MLLFTLDSGVFSSDSGVFSSGGGRGSAPAAAQDAITTAQKAMATVEPAFGKPFSELSPTEQRTLLEELPSSAGGLAFSSESESDAGTAGAS
jgi:hypothetical protein